MTPLRNSTRKRIKEVLDSQDGKSDGPLIAAAGSSGTGGYNVLFVDRGTQLERVDGQARTSLIIDPPDGRMPPMVPRPNRRGRGGGQGEAYAGMSYDSVKNRPLSERCLIGFGSTSGPPMLPVLYNNNYQIVQTKDTVMIMVEMVHDVRVIRMNAQHEPPALDRWLGDSVGHWEGDTLVVETTNVNPENRFRGASEKFKVTERFQLVNTGTILYRATIEDPETYTAMDHRISVPGDQGPGLRVRLPRRQLRHGRHSGRRAQDGNGSEEVSSSADGGMGC